jgi:dimethylargininase
MHSFTKAIVCIPGSNFADGLTTVDFGVPEHATVLHQHERYCEALRECGLELTTLPADLWHPDSTFVEDTAILTPKAAILCRPGAASRAGEIAAMRPVIARFFTAIHNVEDPGTLDGGDICEAEDHFFLGLSHRTNEEGCRQLAGHLSDLGHTSTIVDIRAMKSILHLKSGIAYIGDNTLVAMDEMAGNPLFRGYEVVRVCREESYAANCVRVNERVLVPSGYPKLAAELERRGFHALLLDMSEFRKMDGGLSCLSLRF